MEGNFKLVKYSICFLILLLVPFFSTTGLASTYYVASDGDAKWDDSININTPTSIDIAASNAKAGDTVFLRGGTYTSQLNIANSGTSSSYINFSRYQNETPIFKDFGRMVYISGKSYILIDGLTFSGGDHRQISVTNGSSFIEVRNCTFGGNSGGSAITVDEASEYIYIHSNTFNAMALATSEVDEKNTITIYGSNYCRIINNKIYDGGGHSAIVLSNESHYNVVRGNKIKLTAVTSSENAALDSGITALKNSNYNLIEYNTLHDQQGLSNTGRSEALKNHASSYNIWRRNIVYDWDRYGWGCYAGSYSWDILFNTIYNNTFYNVNYGVRGYGFMDINAGSNAVAKYNQFVNNIGDSSDQYGFSLYYTNKDRIADNQIRANILHNPKVNDIIRFTSAMDLEKAQEDYPAEFKLLKSSDPEFENPSAGNFRLESTSPAIDSGDWLTTIESASGSGTSFIVNNPYFFYDGRGIPGETGDTIKTQNGLTATITSINYSTGQISVDNSIGWSSGEGIALNYYGSKPDIGAIEYSDLTPPTLFIVSSKSDDQ